MVPAINVAIIYDDRDELAAGLLPDARDDRRQTTAALRHRCSRHCPAFTCTTRHLLLLPTVIAEARIVRNCSQEQRGEQLQKCARSACRRA